MAKVTLHLEDETVLDVGIMLRTFEAVASAGNINDGVRAWKPTEKMKAQIEEYIAAMPMSLARELMMDWEVNNA